MRYERLFNHMVEIIYAKGYHAFCMMTDEELAECISIFTTDNPRQVTIKNNESVLFHGKKIKCAHVVQKLFYDCVYYVSNERCQSGNGG